MMRRRARGDTFARVFIAADAQARVEDGETTGDMNLTEQLEALEAEARQAIEEAGTAAQLEELRVRYLGRKEGRLTAIMRELGRLSAEERPKVGAVANRVKVAITEVLEARQAALTASADGGAPRVDLTLPGRARWRGARHPVTLVIDDICE